MAQKKKASTALVKRPRRKADANLRAAAAGHKAGQTVDGVLGAIMALGGGSMLAGAIGGVVGRAIGGEAGKEVEAFSNGLMAQGAFKASQVIQRATEPDREVVVIAEEALKVQR